MRLFCNAIVGHDAVTLPTTMGHIGLIVGDAEPVDPVEPPVDEKHWDEPVSHVCATGHAWHMD